MRDTASVGYDVDCQQGQGSWRQQEDCSFCGIVRGELEGMCGGGSVEEVEMGRMADRMSVGFGSSRCVRGNGVECKGGDGLVGGL